MRADDDTPASQGQSEPADRETLQTVPPDPPVAAGTPEGVPHPAAARSTDRRIGQAGADSTQTLTPPVAKPVDPIPSPVADTKDPSRAPGSRAAVDRYASQSCPISDGQDPAKRGTERDPYATRPLAKEEPAGWPQLAGPTPPEGGIAVPGYEILGESGRGGMGVVYKARHLQLNRLEALKMILAGVHASADELARFRREAASAARLQHPHIVQIYEVGEHNGLPYFALEFMDGGSLSQRLHATPLPPREAARLVETLAQAMQAAHQAGVVHRDLKPDNVLLTSAGTPGGIWKITDFGLAKQLDDDSAKTQSGAIVGTPSYMAPEQAAGRIREIGPLSDVYALGAILYECLTGRPPFKAATTMETLEQVRSEEPVPPSRLQPKVPRDLETICLKCLEKQPHRRFPSAKALADDLRYFLDGEPIQARRVRWWERAAKWTRRRPAAAALVGVLIAFVLALLVTGLLISAQVAQRREDQQKQLDKARAEVYDLHAQGKEAVGSKNLTQAEKLLDRAREKVAADQALADLREDIEEDLGRVRGRLRALDTYQRFIQARDDALFHATLATGESFQTNRKTAWERAGAALTDVGLSGDGQGTLTLGPSFTDQEKAEITSGSYALLLMLAETEARGQPQQSAGPQQLQQALALLDRAEGLGVRTRALHMRRARYLTQLGRKADAAKENERVQTLARETDLDSQDHFLVGHELYSQGQLELAIQEFGRALQLNPQHFWAFWTHYFLGLCCVTAGKPEVAVAHLTICQSQQPELVWIYLLRGFAYGQMKDYAAAEADFLRALALEPSKASTLYVLYSNRGVIRVGLEELRAKGVVDLKQAADLRPDEYQAQANLAWACQLDGRLDEAGKHLDAAIAVAGRQRTGHLRPGALALLYHSRARLHLQRSDREAAVRDLTEAARLAGHDHPLRARAEADRGRVLHLQERFDEALAAYAAALQADPERVNVHRWRGEVFLVQHRYLEAAVAFDAYLEKGGAPSVAVYRQRGLAYAKLHRHAEAVDDYGRALEASPEDEEKAPLYLYRGREYLALNALQPALRDFEEALRLDPNSAEAYLDRADVRVRLGNLRPGVADADQAVRGDPKESRLWHRAARVYAQAAAQLKAEPGQEAQRQADYQKQAVAFVRKTLQLVPADQRQAYWQEQVLKDPVLYPIRFRLLELTPRMGGQDR